MSGDEARAATPDAFVVTIAIQTVGNRKPDPALVAFFRLCLELGDEVDRRRARRAEACTTSATAESVTDQ